jgi:uncharacterized protein YceH (UPF0502 family)
MIENKLSEIQARVIGCMVEKLITTPANYPMTPNAVRVACNQKSNRDPVVDYSEDQVFDALHSLERLGYVEGDQSDFGRTIKYRQLFGKVHDLERGELVIMTELFIRGSQTPGELRGRCERMHQFKDLAEVERCLAKLVARQFVVMLERQPGTKENRWGHLFCGAPRLPASMAAASSTGGNGGNGGLEERVAWLEEQLRLMEERLSALERGR